MYPPRECDFCGKMTPKARNNPEIRKCWDCKEAHKNMWSKKHALTGCVDCGTSSRKPIGAGRCTTCYCRYKYNNDPKRRLSAKKSSQAWMKKNPDKWKKITRRAVKKYQKKNHQAFLLYRKFNHLYNKDHS